MELRFYLGILAGRWWLILAVTIALGLVALFYARNLTKVYQGNASYVLRPRSASVIDDSTVRAIDTLSRRIEIATTFTEVAGSELIKSRALKRMGLVPDDGTELSVTGRVIAGTNVLELTIRGPNRELVQSFAEAINIEFIDYVHGLYDVFELGPLDEPRVRRTPVGPDPRAIVAGAIVAGIVLGAILALGIYYWRLLTAEKKQLNIFDPETGTFNRAYLDLRLKEEFSRARRNQNTFALALLSIDYLPAADTWTAHFRADVLRKVIAHIGSLLREEDILCRYETTTFALLLPFRSADQAHDLLTGVEARFGAEVPGLTTEANEQLSISAGIAWYKNQESNDEIMLQAEQAWETVSESEDTRIAVFGEGREAIPVGE